MTRFAEVAVDAPAGSDRTFSYAVPGSLTVRPGDLVRVPFGSRTIQGVVFSLEEHPQVPQTRDIIDVQDPGPLLDATQLSLARWLSRYYLCSLFEAAAQMLPPGGRARPRTLLSLAEDDTDSGGATLTPFQKTVVDYIRSRGTTDQQRLVRAFGERARTVVATLVRKNIISLAISRGRPSVGPRYVETAALTPQGRRDGPRWLADGARQAPRQAALLSDLLRDGQATALPELRKKHGASAVNGLLARGYIDKVRKAVRRDPLAGISFPPFQSVTLTPSQKEIADPVRAALDDPSNSTRTFVLQGVTGSGKTEVYLSATQRCLALHKKAIVLAPEIALTHQTVQRFASRFPGRVAILHSGLTAGERFDQWWQTRRGAYDVVVGSRGAIFAPVPDLGLIVLDEEHEWTYKQHDASPRYHARDVAMRLSQLTGAVVLLGSASPDVVSYHTSLRGHHTLLTLPNRIRDAGSGNVQTT
ncbi:MAG: DEAD/DEAH box helicase, partial [Chloroflexi bacterium]|nr:DEAD/DEAH box helicase [Chloroflexota bacterium]